MNLPVKSLDAFLRTYPIKKPKKTFLGLTQTFCNDRLSMLLCCIEPVWLQDPDSNWHKLRCEGLSHSHTKRSNAIFALPYCGQRSILDWVPHSSSLIPSHRSVVPMQHVGLATQLHFPRPITARLQFGRMCFFLPVSKHPGPRIATLRLSGKATLS